MEQISIFSQISGMVYLHPSPLVLATGAFGMATATDTHKKELTSIINIFECRDAIKHDFFKNYCNSFPR